MRVSPLRVVLGVIFCMNLMVLYYLYHLQQQIQNNRANAQVKARKVENGITFIIREFEEFDNEVLSIISNLAATFPEEDILVISDKTPYPPIELQYFRNVKVVYLKPNAPDVPLSETCPENFITKKYVVLVPDGVRIDTRDNVKAQIKILEEKYEDSFGNIRIVAVRVAPEDISIAQTKVDLKQWSLYQSFCHRSVCDSVLSDSVIAMKKRDYLNLTKPFLRPMKNSLFIQTSLRHWKTYIAQGIEYNRPRALYRNEHSRSKYEFLQEARLKAVYKEFGIKKVIEVNGEEKWYGCSKETARCFGSLVNDMPEYVFYDRWTPPCCLRALRETAAYVFKILEDSGVRYWLEGGSLLGAVRHQDILLWDYDVDIGIYLEDLPKCRYLDDAQKNGGVVDENSYVWARTDPKIGDYFRVQYSETNHLHVDIFPFYSKRGTMTKKYWIKTHRQDKEFPEHFLQPLTRIKFAGVEANAPNKVREFLEFKFGPGVIENPQYPDPKQKSFPIH